MSSNVSAGNHPRIRVHVAVAYLGLHLSLGLLLFISAGTIVWWQAWLCLGLFAAMVLAMTLYFMRHDKAFLAIRLKAGPVAEPLKSQKVILTLSFIFGIAMLVVAGIEFRLHGVRVPWWLMLMGDAMVVAAMVLVFAAFKANRHAAAVVTVADGQKVVASGPYAVVRHPMYAGELLLFLAVPIALGSFLALIPAMALNLTVLARLLCEEKYLSQNLPGYEDYMRRVKYRVIPRVF